MKTNISKNVSFFLCVSVFFTQLDAVKLLPQITPQQQNEINELVNKVTERMLANLVLTNIITSDQAEFLLDQGKQIFTHALEGSLILGIPLQPPNFPNTSFGTTLPDANAVKKAYFKLSSKIHPDKRPLSDLQEAQAEFALLSNMYKALFDDDQRAIFTLIANKIVSQAAAAAIQPSTTVPLAYGRLSQFIDSNQYFNFRATFAIDEQKFGLFNLLSETNSSNSNLLHIIAEKPYSFTFIRYLLDQIQSLSSGNQTKIINSKNNSGETPLIVALKANQFDTAKKLLNYGADPNAVDYSGTVGWYLAILGKKPDLVKIFLEKGADPTKKDHLGKNAYDYAENDPAILNLLPTRASQLEPSENINDAFNRLSTLIDSKNIEQFKNIFSLEAQKFNPYDILSYKDEWNRNVLSKAIESNYSFIIRYILDQIAKLTDNQRKQIINQSGMVLTPLGNAMRLDQFKTAATLLDLGADPNTPDNLFAFHTAIQKGALVKKFLEKGADPTIKNIGGKDAYFFAQNNPQILSLLPPRQAEQEDMPAPEEELLTINQLGNNLRVLLQELQKLSNWLK